MIAGFYLEGSGRTQFLGLIPEGKAGWYVSGEARERLHCGASLVASQFHSICLYSDRIKARKKPPFLRVTEVPRVSGACSDD